MIGRITFFVVASAAVVMIFVGKASVLVGDAGSQLDIDQANESIVPDDGTVEQLDTATRLAMIQETIDQLPNGGEGTVFCFSPDISLDYYQSFCELHPELCPGNDAVPRYDAECRWFGVSQGTPISLTWSLVPDSTPGANSNLFSGMNAKFGGNQNLWISLIQQCFDRWQALSGVTYTRVTFGGNPWDDGASWGTSGAPGLRGDVRIRMISNDGSGGVLAFNSYPCDGGDMSLDRDEAWASGSPSYRFLRDVVMHEHGHGVGLAHVCPVVNGANGSLMNPFVNTSFDGPQHDDIRGIHFQYGDKRESNDSAASATNLGTILTGSPITHGAVPTPPSVTFPSSIISIDSSANDQDWYKFVVTGPSIANVTVRPRGVTNFDDSIQSGACTGDGIQCCSGNPIDTTAQQNLGFEIRGGVNGTTIIHTANSAPAGQNETASNVALSGSPGTFYIRVFGAGSNTQSQLYLLDVSVVDTTLDITAPSPAPTFAQLLPLSETAIFMQSTTSTDPAGVEYFFNSTLDSNGATDSGWQADIEYIDTGLFPNRSYTYEVKARDFAPPPGPNETAFSSSANTATMIQTPSTFNIGTVTQNSIQITANGTFSFLATASSGMFFEMTPLEGLGSDVWVTTASITITGLTPGTNYSIRAKARNRIGIETAFSQPINVATFPAAGTGACCLANGTCQIVSSGDCLASSGTYQGDGNVCTPNPCPQPTGACCVDTSCSVVTESQCNGLGGAFQGNFTDCTPNPCGVETGACCIADGSCSVETQADCGTLSGTYQGDGSVCSPNPCPQPCALLGDINGDSSVNGVDIAGYVRVKLGTPDGGDNEACADYGNGNLDADTADFIDDMLN